MKGRIEDKASVADGRSEERRRIFLTASAAQGDGSSGVEILDLSASGLLMSTSASLDLDEPVAVVLADGEEHWARIMWHTGRLYGCRFEQSLSRAELGANLLRAHPPRDLPEVGAVESGTETLGDRLRRLRMDSPHTMEELASLVGVTKPTLWKWETGKSRPRHDAIIRISDVFGVAEAELLYGERGSGRGVSVSRAASNATLAMTVAEARRMIAQAAGIDPGQVSISIDFN
ncbi:helix-turn-helix domain-containing protein [Qipengyuania soli]|uniref:Helix-turn-helix domain-containing protein n=1 Tax=Qipengyuania soli TaxID=2782568 RepID=A0A7S8ISH6_9SPHN|nr:helix-turn-helix domain-containing protein [Qipengyuania soli]QPC98478.1 helix-turn-helix domain-containing protein [Qipengyuania soli]